MSGDLRSRTHLSADIRSFPNARISKVLAEEDKFMAEHGGWGARLIYRLAMLLSGRA